MKIGPRFSLRTLFLVFTIGTVACWAYLIGWPRWIVHREQARFVESIKQLKVGMTTDEAHKLVEVGKHCTMIPIESGNFSRKPSTTVNYVWSDANYCIHYVAKNWGLFQRYDDSSPLVGIEAFKMPPQSSDYKPRSGLEVPIGYSYCFDIAVFFMGPRKNTPGFKYEVIYADPEPKLSANQKE